MTSCVTRCLTRSISRLVSYRCLLGVLLTVLVGAFGQASDIVDMPIPCAYVRDEPDSEEERVEREERDRQWAQLQLYAAFLPKEPDTQLLMPVAGVRTSQVADTWGAPRGGGRRHEGQDIFAPRGTPIYAATEGYVWRKGTSNLGGTVVWLVGAGARRYYYAHLDAYGAIEEGDFVTPDTIIGYVGNTGNAITTPPHLHFGVYYGSRNTCNRIVIDPLPLLVNRD